MPKVSIPIANGFYESDSLPISAQECVNWYPNIVQVAALNQETLFGTPGIDLNLSSGELLSDINRGSHVKAGIPYFVNGATLFRLDLLGGVFSLVDLGAIPGSGRVSMADNGTQLMILVPGGDGFIFNEDDATPFQQITDPDFKANGNPEIVVYVDAVFVCSTDSKKFVGSDINDGLAWNALDFGVAESDPDIIVAPVVFKNQLYIGGSETVEAFENVGGADFQFRRSGLFLDKGIFAPFSVINANNTFMFVGGGTNESPAVWQFAGNQMVKVSTTAIDSVLQDLTDTQLSNVFAFSYAQKGAYFVGFTLPETTFVFDTVSGRWHERKSQIPTAGGGVAITRWRINSLVSAYGLVLVGDGIDGRIGTINPNTFTEYSSPIIRSISTQPFVNQMQSFFVPSIELTVESGVGDFQTRDPQIRMSRSINGKTFTDERKRGLGRIGEFARRAIWRRNGRASRFEIFKWTFSAAVKSVIVGATAEVVGGIK